jgi:hypothetical protein
MWNPENDFANEFVRLAGFHRKGILNIPGETRSYAAGQNPPILCGDPILLKESE